MKNDFRFIILVMAILVLGCKQPPNNKKEQGQTADSAMSGLGFGKEQLDEIYHRFPSPEEMMSVLKKSDFTFREQVVNIPQKSSEYLNSRAQALNIGVYSADLAYLTVFGKHNEAQEYFESIYDLSSELRIAAAFDRELLKRAQNNLVNSDSLKMLSDVAFTKISNYLVSNDKEKIFAIISIGGFVEALYLSFNYTGEFSENNVIIQRIADQKLVLENIINYSNVYEGDPAVEGAVGMISPIIVSYNEIIETPGQTKVTKAEDGRLIISGGNTITITKEQYEKLKKATFEVRKNITQN